MQKYLKTYQIKSRASYLHTYIITLTPLYPLYIAPYCTQVTRNNDSVTIFKNARRIHNTLLTMHYFREQKSSNAIHIYPYHSLSHIHKNRKTWILIQQTLVGAQIIGFLDFLVRKLSRDPILKVSLNYEKISAK